jgi:hypothetical protein
MDIRAEDHARFKSLCALHRTTMSAEINAIIAAQLADPDALLTEALYVRCSPDLKREILECAGARRVSVGVLLMQAVALLERQSEKNEGKINGHAEPRRQGRTRQVAAT